jgi:hypothetical protein
LDADMCSWVPDTSSSRTMETKYFKTIDLYWKNEFIMVKVLVEINETYNEVFLQLDDVKLQIKLVDYKITLLVKKLASLDFSELNISQPHVSIAKDNNLDVNFMLGHFLVSYS